MTPTNPVSLLDEALRRRRAGDLTSAVDLLRHACYVWAYNDRAQYELASLLIELRRYAAALDVLMQIDSIVGAVDNSRYLIARILLKEGSYHEARNWLDRALLCPVQPQQPRMLPFLFVTPARLIHDALQLEYLIERGHLNDSYLDELTIIKESFARHFGAPFDDWPHAEADVAVRLEPLEFGTMHRVHRRVVLLGSCECVKHAINPKLPLRRVKLADGEVPHVVIDDFLSADCLMTLRSYLLNSWIWFNDSSKGFAYVGTHQDNGLLTPLISQISEELRTRMPRIFANLTMRQVWAYRNVLGTRAVGIHADAGTVNVNLWITPNEFNKSPATGGLRLFPSKRGEDLRFDEYNGDEAVAGRIVADNVPYVIPYRDNRVVIFDSALFHGSDECSFANEWLGLRTNLTFIFS